MLHRATNLGSVDLATGKVDVFGPSFYGPWTQGGYAATVSSYDRCNLAFSQLLYVTQNSQVVFVLVGNDMTTGEVLFNQTVSTQIANTLAYYAN